MPSSNTPVKDLPLSSLATVPVTAETRAALADAGLSFYPAMTELTAQSLLALATSGEPSENPPCYGRQYKPDNPLCAGCLVSPRCWSSDKSYLRKLKRGEVDAPNGAPEEAVKARLRTFKNKAMPPKRKA